MRGALGLGLGLKLTGRGNIVLDPDTQTFIDRVLADGGTVEDPAFLNSFVLDAKANNYFDDIVAAYSPSWGVKGGATASDLYSITGVGSDITQSTAANQPLIVAGDLLSRTRLAFDGGNDYMTGSFTFQQPETVIFGGIEQEDWVLNRRMFDGGISSRGMAFKSTVTPNIRLFAGASTTENSNMSIATSYSLRCLFNGASSEIQVGSTAVTGGDCGASNMAGFTLGGEPGASVSMIRVGLTVLLNSAIDAAYPAKVNAIKAFNNAAYGTV